MVEEDSQTLVQKLSEETKLLSGETRELERLKTELALLNKQTVEEQRATRGYGFVNRLSCQPDLLGSGGPPGWEWGQRPCWPRGCRSDLCKGGMVGERCCRGWSHGQWRGEGYRGEHVLTSVGVYTEAHPIIRRLQRGTTRWEEVHHGVRQLSLLPLVVGECRELSDVHYGDGTGCNLRPRERPQDCTAVGNWDGALNLGTIGDSVGSSSFWLGRKWGGRATWK